MKFHLFICIFFIFLFSCNKEKDAVAIKIISGNVRNNCTGGPFKDVEVKLIISGDKESNTFKSITNLNGDFSFSNVEIHSSDKYKYYLEIDSYTDYDIINNVTEENFQFYGISKQELNKNQITQSYQIGVSASFKYLNLKFNQGVFITSPDSVNLLLEQRVLHSFEPNRVWSIPQRYSLFNSVITESFEGNLAFSVMGPWTVIIDKWKNGIHTIIEDSIYMGMGETKEYIVPW